MPENIPTGYKKGLNLAQYYKDRGMERSSEAKKWNLQLRLAEDAFTADEEEKSWYSLAGSTLGAAIGFGTGGWEGAQTGWKVGGEGGKWYQSEFISDYEPEKYYTDTDVGKFDVSQKYDIEERNRRFKQADESRFWKDLTETMETVGSLWMMYEGAEFLGSKIPSTGGKGPELSLTVPELDPVSIDPVEVVVTPVSDWQPSGRPGGGTWVW